MAWLFLVVFICSLPLFWAWLQEVVFRRKEEKKPKPVNWPEVERLSKEYGFKVPDFSVYSRLVTGEEEKPKELGRACVSYPYCKVCNPSYRPLPPKMDKSYKPPIAVRSKKPDYDYYDAKNDWKYDS